MNPLISKSISGFFTLMLILAALLFVPAGSLSFWQAWVYLGVTAACIIVLTVYLAMYDQDLLAKRVKAGSAAEKEPEQQRIQRLAGISVIGLFIIPGLDFRFHWSSVPSIASWIAIVGVIVSFLIVFFVFQINSFASSTIEVTDSQSVISTGPYRYVRHPMYAGAALLFITSAIALGSLVALPFAFPVIGVMIARLRHEELFLQQHLRGYGDYCQKVRYRLVPGIW